jgi:hypothetical protein
MRSESSDIDAPMLIDDTDCCSALLRVHLLGDHVLSIFLFCLRPGPRAYFDCRAGSIRALHFAGCLV